MSKHKHIAHWGTLELPAAIHHPEERIEKKYQKPADYNLIRASFARYSDDSHSQAACLTFE